MASLWRWFLILLTGALTLAAAVAFAAPGDDVKALLEQGKAAEAYAVGKKYPEQLGDPGFDFYFGIAAIDTGHAGEGVLALERYLLNFPDNVSARLQLARGYYLLGDDARARDEFEALQKLKPPADVAASIQRFLDSIRLRESRYSTSAGGYIELGIGSDSNVNAGPASSTVTLPFFGPFALSPSSQKTSDSFASLGAGGYVNYPIQPGIALFAIGQGEQRFNSSQSNKQFDLGNLNLTGGVSVLRDKNLYRFGINYGAIRLGTSTYRTSTGGLVEWQYQLDAAQSFSLAGQAAQFNYSTSVISDGTTITTTDNSARNADFYGISAGYRRVFAHRWEPVLSLGVNAGNQHSRTGRPDLVPRTLGANVGLTFTPVARWGVLLGYTYLQSDYQGPDFFTAPDSRHDKYQAYNAALTYLYSRNISFRAEALWSRNSSNADAYAFPRDVYSIKVRYEFK